MDHRITRRTADRPWAEYSGTIAEGPVPPPLEIPQAGQASPAFGNHWWTSINKHDRSATRATGNGNIAERRA